MIRAKIEIVWPHGGAAVQDAELANITAYLISETGNDPPPCDWSPTVRLWAALNAEPARPIAVGQKRMFTVSGRAFPVWDFNDIDVSAARNPTNKLSFFLTVEGVRTLPNIWVHAADARTIFPQADVPVGSASGQPPEVDARVEIVWPHDNLPADRAARANITAYLFHARSKLAIAADGSWLPTVRLHKSLNTETEERGDGIIGMPRAVSAEGGISFLAWDFNDVDVSAARDPLNKLYFWVSVDGVTSYPNIWAHGMDARTIFPQPDLLNSCK